MSNFYNQKSKEVLEHFRTNPDRGLSSAEVKYRQRTYGENTINIQTTPLWRKILEPFMDLFMVILLVALILAIIQGSIPEIIIIAIDIACDAGIFYVQQFSTERVLRNLKKRTVQNIHVLRDGAELELDAVELVPGDIVLLSEGDRVPADGRIVSESGLLTNESMLTGESDSVTKDAKAISGEKKIYEQRNMVFSGSFVITGSAKIVVVATGNSTEYGHIASLASGASVMSPIQEKINQLVIRIAIILGVVAVLVFLIQLLEGLSFFESAEFTLALIVSAVPEDLPIATAIILAIGATRLAKKKALIKELRAIESLGIVSTIASDKTGTLTENRLSLQKLWSKSPTNLGDYLVRAALPASETGDPMDICLWRYASANKIANPGAPLRSYAFDQSIRMSGNLFAEGRAKKNIIYLKGSPEVILKRCRLSAKDYETTIQKLDEFASFGYKVLALAKVAPAHDINELSRLEKSEKFIFLGLCAVSDTIRREAKPAIARARQAGIKVKMVTGDHAGTAFAIGKSLGLAKTPEEVLDCTRIDTLDDDTLAEKAKSASIFARVTPEDKFRILDALKRSEIVAMTGDGVNDVPALTNAHVGIAMGDGPSIVQDAGDIVLVDNNFANITAAIREGRVILANIRRMLLYLLSTNAGEVLTLIGALLIGRAQLLLPIQILWVNLVTDSIMIIPIGLEPAEARLLRQKPEGHNTPLLPRLIIERIVIIAVTMAAITLAVYYTASHFLSHAESNTLAFVALVVMQWANAFTTRGIFESCWTRLTKAKNLLFLLAFIFAFSLQILALFGPLASFVSAVPVPPLALLLAVVFSFIVPVLTVELHKLFYQKKQKPQTR
ncbi:cation-transporting P-type ATPase [Candidatus Saccharibacteria bacterium]|nr:cation-transporting P-type ATPase [Candidatus Saccharibacteria bacterium]